MQSVRGSDLINQQADINTPPHTHHHLLSPSLSPHLSSHLSFDCFSDDSLVVLSLLSISYRLDLPHFLHKPHFAHFFPYKTPQNSDTPTYKYTIQIPLSLSLSLSLSLKATNFSFILTWVSEFFECSLTILGILVSSKIFFWVKLSKGGSGSP